MWRILSREFSLHRWLYLFILKDLVTPKPLAVAKVLLCPRLEQLGWIRTLSGDYDIGRICVICLEGSSITLEITFPSLSPCSRYQPCWLRCSAASSG